MPERTLETRYRLLAATFRASAAAAEAERIAGEGWGEGLDLLVYVLTHDLSMAPRDLDREHVMTLVGSLLPGRLAGNEPYRSAMPDLAELFLLHVATEEGLATAWEWTSAVGQARDAFESALARPDRPVPAGGPKRAPDRRQAPKLGRNDPCFCGSGRKYKHCCLKLAP
jgi:hypothetical protein